MTINDKDQLNDVANVDWLAMQYVLGELTDVEVSEFEDQLFVDEDARRRLVEAVRIIEAVENVRVPAIRRTGFRQAQLIRFMRYTGVAIAAGIVIAVGLWASTVDFEDHVALREIATDSDETESERLVALWAESGSSLGMGTESELGDEITTEASTSLLPPDWMLAAVEQELRSAPSLEGHFDANDNTIERN